MTVVSLVSAKGSPGVTTAAAALATMAVAGGERAWWVELDPSGGSGWIRTRPSCPTSEPTLAELAQDLRDGTSVADWTAMTVPAPPGVPAVLAPSSDVAASTVIGEGPERWATALRTDGLVVIDAGRWNPRQPTADRIAGSDLVGVVCRSTVESVEHVRHWIASLRESARCPVLAIVVGTRPYPPAEVADAVRLPLAGEIEWRRNDVGALWAKGASRRQIAGTWLGRSASRTVTGLLSALPTRPTGAPLAALMRTSGRDLSTGRFTGS